MVVLYDCIFGNRIVFFLEDFLMVVLYPKAGLEGWEGPLETDEDDDE